MQPLIAYTRIGNSGRVCGHSLKECRVSIDFLDAEADHRAKPVVDLLVGDHFSCVLARFQSPRDLTQDWGTVERVIFTSGYLCFWYGLMNQSLLDQS